MEEFIGELWHRLISSQVAQGYPEEVVDLAPLLPQLGACFRGFGGVAGKQVEAADSRLFYQHRSILQRVAGSHRRFPVCWQDERSLRLPPQIDVLPSRELNESLFFWLAALAAELPQIGHWFSDNQRATQSVLRRRPGLVAGYHRLAAAVVRLRSDPLKLPKALQARERAIQQALLDPGSVAQLPKAVGHSLPVWLWIYPAPLRSVGSQAKDDIAADHSASSAVTQSVDSPRRTAQRIDDQKQTDGLLIFKLECLFSWAEQADLDRCQQEDLDQDMQSAADDLDIINLSRQRRRGSGKLKFDLDLPAAENDDLPIGEGLRLPEWDYSRSLLRPDHCLLQPMLADQAPPAALPASLKAQARALQRQFSLLRPERRVLHRQPFGDELDLDAWLDAQTDRQALPGRPSHDDNFYLACSRDRRSLSTLVLADLSMSTESGVGPGVRVIDLIRDSLLLFAEALSGCGDPFAIYGFSSIRNTQVRYQLLKNFNESYGDQARGRLMAIEPGYYTRMGAAIRQSTAVLKPQSSAQRLLLIISDGKPNDIDRYEGRYGIEDTRQAVLEAKRQGVQPFCVTIDPKGSDYLAYLFGDQGFALVNDIRRLPALLPKIYLNLTAGQ